MKRVMVKIAAAFTAAVLCASAAPVQVLAGPSGEVQKSVEVPATKPYSGDINKLEAAKDAPQMIVIISNPEDPARGNLSWYRRDPSGRLVSVMNEVCVTGMNGVVSPEEKQEGDMKTPSGLYHFSGAYGLKMNPGSKLPYHQFVSGDYWVDDPESTHYNKLVNTSSVTKDWKSAEDLMNAGICYDFILAIDYNKEAVPGKGSAIFLHCPKAFNNTGTSGCISISEEQMEVLLKNVTDKTKVLIVKSEEELANY